MQNSLGSGVIVGASGIVVTNEHVIQGGDDIIVVLPDKREIEAEVMLRDRRTDLAVLRINLSGERLPIREHCRVITAPDGRGARVDDLCLFTLWCRKAIGNRSWHGLALRGIRRQHDLQAPGHDDEREKRARGEDHSQHGLSAFVARPSPTVG